MVKYRKFRKSDIIPVGELIIDTYKKYNHTKSAKKMLKIYQDYYDTKINSWQKIVKYFAKSPISYVASDGGKIVGVVRGRPTRLVSLYVAGNYHHRGIATKLVNLFEKEAKRQGSKKIKIRSSLYGEQFYRKMGYKKSTGKRLFYDLKIQPMKKILLSFIILTLTFSLAGCFRNTQPTVEVEKVDTGVAQTGTIIDISSLNGQAATTTPGDILYLKLAGKANSGYQWNYTSPTSTDFLMLMEHKVTGLADANAPDGLFTSEWRLKVEKTGTFDLGFNYAKGKGKPEQFFKLRVVSQ